MGCRALGTPPFVSAAEGRPKLGVVRGEEHRGLLVTRKWTTPDGEPLPDGPIRVGDLIYVEVWRP